MTAPPRTPIETVHDAFIAHEEARGLWDLTAYGRPYWHAVRYQVQGWLLQALGLSGRRQGGFSDLPLRERLRVHPRRWPTTARRAHWADLRPVDLLVAPHPRFVQTERGWVCPYTGPLVEGLPHRRLVVKDLYDGRHQHPIPGADVRYLEWARRAAELAFLARDAWRGGWLGPADRARVDAWVADLERAFDARLDRAAIFAHVRKAVRNDLTLARVYTHLLDRTRPRAVVLAVHYSHRNLTLTRVARARGVPVVEVQHGVISSTHLAYNLAPGRRPDAFPDYLATFGDYWRDTTPGLPLPAERTPAVGFGWLERERARATPYAPDPDRRVVLVVSQGAVGAALADAAVALAARLDPARWRVRFKHHPSDLAGWRQRYPALAASAVDVIERPVGIYDALASAHAQVGVYSTALYEGLAFGLRTCVLTAPGHEAMRPLADAGAVALCADAEALAEALEAPPGGDALPLDRVWRPGAAANFRAFIDDLIGPPASGAR